ncbi:MAG: tRNA 4-thiouridine(8) synthase ThiI [Clostridiales bacterium]|nr:tRNA 4-thiouridine(8) synthase ThiI [Clostridiales bacterium]HOA84614.1 tRNA uracil 4-sulfurtransferase ThiI [Bacillota bacterium]
MKEVILCKYGEIVLKGANRGWFENMLCRRINECAGYYGNFKVYRAQSTVFIEPIDESSDLDGVYEAVQRIFGIIAVCRAVVAAKDMDSILDTAVEYIPKFLAGKKSFKVEAKRSDKSFPLNSIEIAKQVGTALHAACPGIAVDVHTPEVVVRVEIREFGAYIHAGQLPGAGGLPVGSNGRGLLLLSGGIDSPVAGWMMAKRGVLVESLHFESFPYTSERAKEKVMALTRILARWAGDIDLHIVSLTRIQEELKRTCNEEYFTLLLRRYMMHIASRVARARDCGALITGESLGQVASQTLQAIAVTDAVAGLPVFRPLIGLDKEEIIRLARRIGTYDTSILPYEDCCTVFTPRHPKTRPQIERVLAEERKLDFNSLAAGAEATLETIRIRAEY